MNSDADTAAVLRNLNDGLLRVDVHRLPVDVVATERLWSGIAWHVGVELFSRHDFHQLQARYPEISATSYVLHNQFPKIVSAIFLRCWFWGCPLFFSSLPSKGRLMPTRLEVVFLRQQRALRASRPVAPAAVRVVPGEDVPVPKIFLTLILTQLERKS